MSFLIFVATGPINATLPDMDSLMPSMPQLLQLVPFNGQLTIDDQVITFGDPKAIRPPQPPVQTENKNQEEPESRASPQTPTSGAEQSNSISPMPQPSNAIPPVPTNFESRIPDFGPIPSLSPAFPALPSSNAPLPSLPNIGSTEVGSSFSQNSRSNFNDEFTQPASSTPVPFGMPRSNNPINSAPSDSPTNRNQGDSSVVVMPMVVSPGRLLDAENAEAASTPLPSLATGSTIPIPALFSMNNNERTASESRQVMPITLSPIESPRSKSADEPSKTREQDVKVNRGSTFFMSPTGTQLSNDSILSEASVRSALQLPPLQTNTNKAEEQIQRTESLIPFAFTPTLFSQSPKIPTLAELDQQMQRQRSESILRAMNGQTTK